MDEEDEFSSDEDGFVDDGRAAPDDEHEFEEEDDDSFDGAYGGHGGGAESPEGAEGVVSNRPYDEAMELSDNDSQPSPSGAGGMGEADDGMRFVDGGKGMGESGIITNQHHDEAEDCSSEDSVDDDEAEASMGYSAEPPPAAVQERPQPRSQAPAALAAMAPGASMGRDVARAENFPQLSAMPQAGDEDSDGEGGSPGGAEEMIEGMYDPSEYEELNVSSEIKEIFQYIGRYKPHNIELETKMRPFIPDYIPAVGEIDPFVKVPRPDNKPDALGLAVLDEPAAQQSDPTVFTLQLRAVTKSSGLQPMAVRAVEDATKNPKAISGWISSINDLHRHKPPPSVRYSKPMPDVEALMQIWPAQFEELLDSARLPDAELSVELAELVRVFCGILDIPVHNSLTESLHVLFTLYSDFKANVHFQQQLNEEEGGMGGGQQEDQLTLG